MTELSLEDLRSKVCAGCPEHTREYLKYIEPVMESFVTPSEKDRGTARRKQKIMQELSVEILRSGFIPRKDTLRTYLTDLFYEIFSFDVRRTC